MRQEILTGIERRRRWSDDEKLGILGEVGVDGLRVADVARRHDITRQHIYQWRREFRHRGLLETAGAVLVPVELAADGEQCVAGDNERVEIVLGNGRSLRVAASVGEGTLVRLIRILEAA